MMVKYGNYQGMSDSGGGMSKFSVCSWRRPATDWAGVTSSGRLTDGRTKAPARVSLSHVYTTQPRRRVELRIKLIDDQTMKRLCDASNHPITGERVSPPPRTGNRPQGGRFNELPRANARRRRIGTCRQRQSDFAGTRMMSWWRSFHTIHPVWRHH